MLHAPAARHAEQLLKLSSPAIDHPARCSTQGQTWLHPDVVWPQALFFGDSSVFHLHFMLQILSFKTATQINRPQQTTC